MMWLLSLLSSGAQIALKLVGYFVQREHDGEIVKSTQAVERERNAGAAIDEIQKAKDARDDASGELADHPERLRESDGFARGNTSGGSNPQT